MVSRNRERIPRSAKKERFLTQLMRGRGEGGHSYQGKLKKKTNPKQPKNLNKRTRFPPCKNDHRGTENNNSAKKSEKWRYEGKNGVTRKTILQSRFLNQKNRIEWRHDAIKKSKERKQSQARGNESRLRFFKTSLSWKSIQRQKQAFH